MSQARAGLLLLEHRDREVVAPLDDRSYPEVAIFDFRFYLSKKLTMSSHVLGRSIFGDPKNAGTI